MKILIAGSRNIPNHSFVWDDLIKRVLGMYGTDGIEIVSGMARGADTIAIDFAKHFHIEWIGFPANWDQHGKTAGYIRNKEMSVYADELIAYWDGKSNGTKNMIDLMGIARKPTTIIYV